METMYILSGKTPIELTKQVNSFWHDQEGTVYAFKDGITTDEADRCGVAPIALPQWPFFQTVNDACAPHDFAYSSPVYQAFHTRKEADNYLESLLTLSGHPILAEVFSEIARILGAPFWEGKE